MSIYFEIQANSNDEFKALEAEGAPYFNMSNSNGLHFQRVVLGIEPDYSGTLDPCDLLEREAELLSNAEREDGFFDSYWRDRTLNLLEVARAARALDRQITFC